MTFSAYFNQCRRWVSVREFRDVGGYSNIWHVAWPLIILNASNVLMMVLNRVFLSWRSSDEIAAAMPTNQMFFTLMSFCLITTSFSSTIVAQYHGAGDREGCVRTVWNGFYFGAIMAALLAYALPAAGTWILLHNGHASEISQLEAEYFVGMAPCAGFACMECALLSFFTGRGSTVPVAAIKLGACAVCVPLNYIFVFGRFGMPELGILGAGFANSVASLLSLLVSAAYFLGYPQTVYQTRRFKNFEWRRIARLIKFGMPAGLQTLIRNAAFAVVVMLIGALGKAELTAASIACTINMLGNLPLIGLMDAASIVTGQCIGRGRIGAADRVAGRAFRMLMIWWGAAAMVYAFWPGALAGVFCSPDAVSGEARTAVIAGTVVILRLSIYGNVMDALRFIAMGSLRGAGDTKIPLYLGLSTAWLIQIPGTLLIVCVVRGTLLQVWLMLLVYLTVDAGLMIWRKRSGAWKSIRVIDNALPPQNENQSLTNNRKGVDDAS